MISCVKKLPGGTSKGVIITTTHRDKKQLQMQKDVSNRTEDKILFYSLFSSIVAMRYPWKYEPHLIPSAPGELFCCNPLKYYAVVSLPRRWYNTLQETQLAGYLSKTERKIMAKNQVFSIFLITSTGSYFQVLSDIIF